MAQALTSIDEPLNVLYYGDGGTGKTTHIAHMADLGKIRIVNAESGVKRRALERSGVNVDNIEIFPEVGEKLTYETLEADWLEMREALHKDPTAYVGYSWDSITEIYKVLLDDVIAAGQVVSDRTGKKRDPREDYREMSDQVRKLVRRCRDLPCHFAASALERRDVDDSDGSVAYRPSITPGLQTDLYGWFDLVCHTSIAEVGEFEQYRGLFKPLGKYRGKDRYKVMPKQLVDPTFDRVLAYVEESLEPETDPVMVTAQEQIQAQKTNEKEKEAQADA